MADVAETKYHGSLCLGCAIGSMTILFFSPLVRTRCTAISHVLLRRATARVGAFSNPAFPPESPGGPYLPLPSQRQKAFQNQTEMRTREFCSKWLHDSCLAKNAVIEHANHRLPKGRDSSEAPLDLITY